MYSLITNIQIDKNRIYVEYHSGTKVEFISDVDMLFHKHKEYIVTGNANGRKASCIVDKNNNLMITSYDGYVAVSFYFPSEFVFNVNKAIKKGKMFDLNYCKHLRNTFSKLQFSEIWMNPEFKMTEDIEVKIEKLRNLTMQYSTGVYSKVSLIYYIRSNGSILYTITKAGDVMERNILSGISLANTAIAQVGVPMYEQS